MISSVCRLAPFGYFLTLTVALALFISREVYTLLDRYRARVIYSACHVMSKPMDNTIDKQDVFWTDAMPW